MRDTMTTMAENLVRIVIPLVFGVWAVSILADLAISGWVFAGVIFALSAATVLLRHLSKRSAF